MLSRYLFRRDRDGTLSGATTAVNSPGGTSPNSPAAFDRKGSVRYTGPKRTFSLVRGDGKKDALRLVDKPVNHLDKATGGKIKADMPDSLADCLVDFIQLGSSPQPTTIFDDTEIQPASSPLSTHPTNALEPEREQWTSLEVDTRQFLSSVVPSWTTEDPPRAQSTKDLSHKHQRKPNFTTIIRAFIKRSGKGFVIRLFHRTKTGFDEVADIHMLGVGEGAVHELEDPRGVPVELDSTDSKYTRDSERTTSSIASLDAPQYSYARPLKDPTPSAPIADAWLLGNLSEGSASYISGARTSLDDAMEENLGQKKSVA
jgi:hypothetical protein